MSSRDFTSIIIRHQRTELVNVELHASPILLGSGGHCDIRLGAELMAPEQLRIERREGGVEVMVLAAAPQTRFGGVPSLRGIVRSGEVLEVGELQLQISVSVAERAPGASLFKKVALSFLVLLALTATAAGAVVMSLRLTKTSGARGPASPDLFSDLAKVGCLESESHAARASAGQLLQEAASRRERAPFNPREAVKAVVAYERARRCLEVSGDSVAAAQAAENASSMRKKTQKAFHVHRVRLEHALSTKDEDQARSELRVLNNYLAGRKDAYAVWVQNLARAKAAGK